MTYTISANLAGTWNLLVGPIIDAATGAAITDAAVVLPAVTSIMQPGGTLTSRTSTGTITHLGSGYYNMPFLGADFSLAYGAYVIVIQYGGALPVWHHVVSVDEETYKAVISGTAPIRADVRAVRDTADAPVTEGERAAKNLQSMYDDQSTGIRFPHAPAQQQQIDALEIAIGGAARAQAIEDGSQEIASGTVSGGGWEATQVKDGNEGSPSSAYAIVAAGGSPRFWGFKGQITSDSEAVRAVLHTYIPSSGSPVSLYARDWSQPVEDWEFLGSISSELDKDQSLIVPMFSRHTNKHTGTEPFGQVWIRAQRPDTDEDLYVDQLYFEYNTIVRSVGYEGGAVWLDTLNGVPGTQPYINGTADNPCSTIAEARAIADSIGSGLRHITCLPGSQVTLPAGDWTGWKLSGSAWDLNPNNQNMDDGHVSGANITDYQTPGTPVTFATGSSYLEIADCVLDSVKLPRTYARDCILVTEISMSEGQPYVFDNCRAAVINDPSEGTLTVVPQLQFTASVAAQVAMHNYRGSIEIDNMGASSTDHLLSINGMGFITFLANCTGGVCAVRGHFDREDLSNGSVTIYDEANYPGPDSVFGTVSATQVDGTTILSQDVNQYDDDFFTTGGGSVLVFTSNGLKGQPRKISSWQKDFPIAGTTTITLSQPTVGLAQVGDRFMIIGRIEP